MSKVMERGTEMESLTLKKSLIGLAKEVFRIFIRPFQREDTKAFMEGAASILLYLIFFNGLGYDKIGYMVVVYIGMTFATQLLDYFDEQGVIQ